MSGIFLSYVREDVERARALALLLERKGYSVWWDRRIRGGAQYSTEIEAALKSADKIVVLWSAKSVESPWVRDEAAVGRDTGRFVPVTIDGTEPPLGFRQFQTIVLPHGRIRTGTAEMSALVEVLGASSVAACEPSRGKRHGQLDWLRPWLAPAAAALVLALIGSWWWASRASAHPPTIVIEGVNEQSRQVARELAVKLGDLQSARSDTFQLISGSGDADLILQVDAGGSSTNARRDVSLLSGRDKSILWSTSLQEAPDRTDDLSQQLTLTSERVLSCALEALSDDKDRIDAVTLKQYLNGCSQLEDVYGIANSDPALWRPFDQVIARAPHFRGAWAKLLAMEANDVAAPEPPPALVAKLRAHIDQAQRLGIDVGELFLAKAALLPPGDFLARSRLFDQAVNTEPEDPLLHRMRSQWLQGLGRMSDGVADAAEAAALDPLSPALADGYLSALAYSGRVDAAFAQLRKAESTWPTARNIKFARYRLDLRFGDPKEALALYRNEMAGVDPVQESFIEARIDPTPAKIERAIDDVRVENAQEPRDIVDLMQTLAQFGRKDEALDVLLHYPGGQAIGWNNEVLFRPALHDMWRDPRSIAAAAHVGFLAYWEKSGKWPDFCFEPTLPYDCKKEALKYRA